MKTTFSTVKNTIGLSLMAALMLVSSQNAYAAAAVAQQIQGEVMVHKTTDALDAWTAVTQDTALENGDSIKTRQGTCVLAYSGDQATFAMEANTSLTLEETASAQDLKLLLGKIRGKVNHDKVIKPFEVVTPAAIATVRGTEVDFGYNEQGQLTVDLHNGNIQVVNDDADMQLDLGGKKLITIQYDKEANLLTIKNDPSSDGEISYTILGATKTLKPGEQKDEALSTAEQGTTIADTDDTNDEPENLDEGRRVTDNIN